MVLFFISANWPKAETWKKKLKVKREKLEILYRETTMEGECDCVERCVLVYRWMNLWNRLIDKGFALW